MATTYLRGAGISTNALLPNVALTDEERVVWSLFADHAAEKAALWIDVPSARMYKGLTADGAAAPARLLDRCGDRYFAADAVMQAHPIIVTDSITGKPALMFGAGGVAPNALDQTYNGALVSPSLLDAAGAEKNNKPLFLRSTGWSLAYKIRLPVPSTTVNGVTFGSITGGTVLGGASADGMTVSSSFSSGQLKAQNDFTVDVAGQRLLIGPDLRDAAWHDVVISYDHAAGSMRGWIDGTAHTPITSGVTTDIAATTGANKPVIGGVVSGPPTNRFIGFLSCLYWLPGPVFGDTEARLAVRNLMATR